MAFVISDLLVPCSGPSPQARWGWRGAVAAAGRVSLLWLRTCARCELGGCTSPSLPSRCPIPVRLRLELGRWQLDSVPWAQAVVGQLHPAQVRVRPQKSAGSGCHCLPCRWLTWARVGDPRRTGGGRQTSRDWGLRAGSWYDPVRWEESPVYQRKPRPEERRTAQGHTARTHTVWFSSAGPGSLQRGWSGQAR